jgi:hypothetical protein
MESSSYTRIDKKDSLTIVLLFCPLPLRYNVSWIHLTYSWSNIANDLLECSHCHAKLCIAFHPQLTPSQKATLTLKYQEQLATQGHANSMCLFWDNSSINKNDGDDNDEEGTRDFPVPLF